MFFGFLFGRRAPEVLLMFIHFWPTLYTTGKQGRPYRGYLRGKRGQFQRGELGTDRQVGAASSRENREIRRQRRGAGRYFAV
jgi:hypothetical protein